MSVNDFNLLSQKLSTPIGPMLAIATEQQLCLLEFTDRNHLDRQIAKFNRALPGIIKSGENQILALVQTQLNEYFAGSRQDFTVPLRLTGTEFQQSAWQVLQQIAYGYTVSYQQQAEALNRPKAVRAVANANSCNKIPIIIPCHRVIGKNGKLTGYAGKLWRKQFLLALEGL